MKKNIFFLCCFLSLLTCDDIIEVEDISTQTVTVLAPTDSALLNITNITFSWQAVADAENYTIQIATPDFENALQVVLDSTVLTTSFSKTLEVGQYEWRVNAKNTEYQTLFSTQTFTVEE